MSLECPSIPASAKLGMQDCREPSSTPAATQHRRQAPPSRQVRHSMASKERSGVNAGGAAPKGRQATATAASWLPSHQQGDWHPVKDGRLQSAPVGCELEVQVLPLEKAVHQREDLHHHLVLPQIVALLVDDLIAAFCRPCLPCRAGQLFRRAQAPLLVSQELHNRKGPRGLSRSPRERTTQAASNPGCPGRQT